ncbi:type II toxin-antitoxin system HicA family toxin [Candidatus Poribacteria bacterium]|nr:type II toxin-antitoxin system HicA family toxin [Candidatus Poribacteria bacterium]
MPRLTPVSWNELVQRLYHFGFEGPYRGGKHPYWKFLSSSVFLMMELFFLKEKFGMIKEDFVLTIPNPHRREISVDLLSRILKRAGISRKQWLEQVDS